MVTEIVSHMLWDLLGKHALCGSPVLLLFGDSFAFLENYRLRNHSGRTAMFQWSSAHGQPSLPNCLQASPAEDFLKVGLFSKHQNWSSFSSSSPSVVGMEIFFQVPGTDRKGFVLAPVPHL